ncbi:FIMAH domain-containing protein [Micromonospora sp. SL4-19]|uniref:FIMAH domain-containing protein n=1 Tax=Micromonospora sp. SL4-19 TaxID=3399129 RepID=UPI003A4D7DEA
MMSGVSANSDPRFTDPDPPTTALPVVNPGRGRHRSLDDGRRVMLVAAAGAVVAVVAAALMVGFGGDDGPKGSGPVSALATPADEPSVAPSELPATEAPSPTPTASPSPRPTVRPPARPEQLVAGLRATVDGLAQQGDLRRGAARELNKRLREVEEKLADGEAREAREKLRGFVEKLINLREDDKISNRGYELLIAGTTQLSQALPAR